MLIVIPRACGPAWLVDSVRYVDGARAEIVGLKGLDSRHVAVADSRFASTLGQAVATTVGDTVVLARHTPNTLEYKVTSARGSITPTFTVLAARCCVAEDFGAVVAAAVCTCFGNGMSSCSPFFST